MTTLILVRHGETVWHRENRYTGRSDIELTPEGHQQAKRLADWTAGNRPDALVCSPMRRARDTTAPVAGALGMTPRIEPELREIDFGSAEGRTLAEIDSEVLAAFHRDPAENFFPGGENPAFAVARCIAVLSGLATEFTGGTVMVIAHSTLFRMALCELLGLPIGRYRAVFPALHNCALNTVRLDEHGAALLSLNVRV
ncbi:MAG TPA: histidine phosphatase family protein [Pseudonocardiaceae bacterium]|nr:histidine phosphatase family protein [Pseudonocardiaceae bacterium]